MPNATPTSSTPPVSGRVPLLRKLAFASADLYGGGVFNIVNFLYPTFLALMVGIPAFWIGFIMLVARVWDAVTDLVMGYVSDATLSRLGKRRVYITLAAPLAMLSMFLMFYPYAMSSLALRIISVLMSYMFFDLVQTTATIPYYALSSEIAADYLERAKCNAVRLAFSITSSIVCVAVPGMIVDAAADPATGYKTMSLIFGAYFMIALLITGLFAKEQIQSPPNRERFNYKTFIAPLRLKPFRQYLTMQFCLSMTMAIMSALFFFYIDFYIMRDVTATGQSNALRLIAAALMFSMQAIALPIYVKLIALKGKTWVYRLGAAGWIVMGLTIFLIPPGANPIVIYLLAALMGFFISGVGVIPHTMFGDVVDAGELLLGQRSEGAFGGLNNLLNKSAQAVGMSIVMGILDLSGFIEKDPASVIPVLFQPLTAQYALMTMMALAPLIFMSIGIIASRRYRITAALQARIIAVAARKGEEGYEEARESLLREM